MIAITWTKSAIAYNRDQKATIQALGLKRVGHTVVRRDTPAVRGMIRAVQHLVTVKLLKDAE